MKESEFGGVDGLVQPRDKGHVPTPSETLMLMHQSDENDATSGTGTGGSSA